MKKNQNNRCSYCFGNHSIPTEDNHLFEFECLHCGDLFNPNSVLDYEEILLNVRSLRQQAKFDDALESLGKLEETYNDIYARNFDFNAEIITELYLAKNGVIYESEDDQINKNIPILYKLDYSKDIENSFKISMQSMDTINKKRLEKIHLEVEGYKAEYKKLSDQMASYDIYICYYSKETQKQALFVYELIQEHFPKLNVFYAPKSIEFGEFGPHLHYALDTARLMIIISASNNTLKASKWVLHEINRFKNRMIYDRDLVILPLYDGNIEEGLPYEIRNSTQSFDILKHKTWLNSIDKFFVKRDQENFSKHSEVSNQNEPARPELIQTDLSKDLMPNANCSLFLERLYYHAKDGDADAQHELGMAYLEGKYDLQVNLSTAYEWLTLAARQNQTEAMYYLGSMCLDQNLLDLDYDKAFEWLEKSASQNDDRAQLILGGIYENGQNRDIETAMKWYLKAANSGNLQAQRNVANLYDNEEVFAEGKSEAIKWSEIAAQNGDVEDWITLAKRYYNHETIDPDNINALRYFKKASLHNNAEALMYLGFIHQEGNGVEADIEKAIAYYEASAEMENAVAYLELGKIYYSGENGEVDFEKALNNWKNSSELGNHEAITYLADMYFDGVYVDQNQEKARELYEKACEMGNHYACYSAGWIYHHGNNEIKDYAKALGYYSKSKDFEPSSLVGLGDLYLHGDGVRKNHNTAISYYNQALKQGSEPASERLNSIEDRQRESAENKRLNRIKVLTKFSLWFGGIISLALLVNTGLMIVLPVMNSRQGLMFFFPMAIVIVGFATYLIQLNDDSSLYGVLMFVSLAISAIMTGVSLLDIQWYWVLTSFIMLAITVFVFIFSINENDFTSIITLVISFANVFLSLTYLFNEGFESWGISVLGVFAFIASIIWFFLILEDVEEIQVGILILVSVGTLLIYLYGLISLNETIVSFIKETMFFLLNNWYWLLGSLVTFFTLKIIFKWVYEHFATISTIIIIVSALISVALNLLLDTNLTILFALINFLLIVISTIMAYNFFDDFEDVKAWSLVLSIILVVLIYLVGLGTLVGYLIAGILFLSFLIYISIIIIDSFSAANLILSMLLLLSAFVNLTLDIQPQWLIFTISLVLLLISLIFLVIKILDGFEDITPWVLIIAIAISITIYLISFELIEFGFMQNILINQRIEIDLILV